MSLLNVCSVCHCIFNIQDMATKTTLASASSGSQPWVTSPIFLKKIFYGIGGQKFKVVFSLEVTQDLLDHVLQAQKSGLGALRTLKSSDKRACNLPLGLGGISLYSYRYGLF